MLQTIIGSNQFELEQAILTERMKILKPSQTKKEEKANKVVDIILLNSLNGIRSTKSHVKTLINLWKGLIKEIIVAKYLRSKNFSEMEIDYVPSLNKYS